MESFSRQYAHRFRLPFQTFSDGGAPFAIRNYTCIAPDLHIGGITIYQPALVPFTFFGMFVGLFCALQIQKHMKNKRGASIYSMMFFAFFGMNFTGLFSNCFLPSGWVVHNNGSFVAVFLALSDAYFSSWVNTAFTLCILVDLGLLKEKSSLFRLLIATVSVAIAVGYYETFYGQWMNGFIFLYKTLAQIGFVVFFLGSVIFLLIHRNVLWVGLGALGLALANGLLGFKSLALGDWFCNHISLWVGVGPVWFFFSAASLFSLFIYFLATSAGRDEEGEGAALEMNNVDISEKEALLQA